MKKFVSMLLAAAFALALAGSAAAYKPPTFSDVKDLPVLEEKVIPINNGNDRDEFSPTFHTVICLDGAYYIVGSVPFSERYMTWENVKKDYLNGELVGLDNYEIGIDSYKELRKMTPVGTVFADSPRERPTLVYKLSSEYLIVAYFDELEYNSETGETLHDIAKSTKDISYQMFHRVPKKFIYKEGWQVIGFRGCSDRPCEKKLYYIKSDGTCLTGSAVIDGVTYEFSENGECLYTGWTKTKNELRYWKKGRLFVNRHFGTGSGKRYYADMYGCVIPEESTDG